MRLALPLLLLFFAPSLALAQDEGTPLAQTPEPPVPAPLENLAGASLRDVLHARNFAMGGGYRALGLGTEAVTGNPAAMALYPRYMVDATGAWDVGAKFAFGTLSILDSSTGPVSAGVSYQLVSLGKGSTRRTTHINTVASAFSMADFLFVGFSARHVLMTGAREANAITADAGLLARLFSGFTLSLSGHNLIDIGNPDLGRYFSSGLGYTSGMFTAAADLEAEFGDTPVRLAGGGGLEYILAEAIPVRVGYRLDRPSGRKDFSTGLGIFFEGGAVDLGYRHQLGGPGRLLALTFRIQTSAQR